MKKLSCFIIFLILSVNVLFAEDKPYSFNGDIRIKSQSSWDDRYIHKLKGEATFGFDYDNENSWLNTKVKLVTPFQGSSQDRVDLSVTELSIGYQPYLTEDQEFYFEIGRQKLDSLFDSKIQFSNQFNGLHLAYKLHSSIGEVSIHGGPHVVDSISHSYGVAAEASIKNLLNSPLTVKYHLMDWLETSNSFYESNFLISQILCKYDIPMGLVRSPNCMIYVEKLAIYAAYLKNHRACKESQGFYIGMTLGEVVKAKDLALDLNYQYLEDFCVPNFDVAGIGTGVQLKGTYAVSDHFHVQGKICSTKTLEFAAIYKW